ncbi:MAG: hypothetical protein ACRD02_08950, partial [Acidimicrobiia bacterium]
MRALPRAVALGWAVVACSPAAIVSELPTPDTRPAPVQAPITTTLDFPRDTGLYTSIAIGADGLPVIAYASNSDAELRVAHCSNPRCTSADLTTVDDDGAVGGYASLAIGSDGLPVIAYFDATRRDLKLARCLDAGCRQAIRRTLDEEGSVGAFSSIAISEDGRPLIAYQDETN